MKITNQRLVCQTIVAVFLLVSNYFYLDNWLVAVNVNDGDKLLLIQGRIRLQTLAFTVVHRLDGKKAVIIMMANVKVS